MSYLTPEEFAERIGVTPKTVRERLRRGFIIGEKHGGRWTISESELVRHLEPQQITLEEAVYVRLVLEVINNEHVKHCIEQGMRLWAEDVREKSKAILDDALIAGIIEVVGGGKVIWRWENENRDIILDELILDFTHEDIATRLVLLDSQGTLRQLRDSSVKSTFSKWFEELDDTTKSALIKKMTELGL